MKRTFYTLITTVLSVILVFSTSGCSQLYDLINDSGDALKQDLFEVSDSLENNIESLSIHTVHAESRGLHDHLESTMARYSEDN